MAGDWIKIRSNLWDDPRVSRLVDMTDSTEAAIVGSLYWLWSTADQHTEDGTLHGLTIKSIDRKTGVKGFGDALCAIGWLEAHADYVEIIGFSEHNGESAKKRCQTAKRVGKLRSCNADVTQPALQIEQESVTGALAREREEKEKSNKDSVTDVTGDKPPKLTDPYEIIFGFGVPLLTNAGTAEKLARSFLGGLRKQHGDSALIDKLRECARAKPLQPLEWLAAALPPSGHKPKQAFGAPVAKYAAAAAAIFDDDPAANNNEMKHMGDVINA